MQSHFLAILLLFAVVVINVNLAFTEENDSRGRYVFRKFQRGGALDNSCNSDIANALQSYQLRINAKLDELVLQNQGDLAVATGSGSAGSRPNSRKRSPGCPTGFQGIDGWNSCYQMSAFNASWHEARKYCNVLNGELLAVELDTEHYLVTFLIQNDLELKKTKKWWTGGNYVLQSGKWMWASRQYLKEITWQGWPGGAINRRQYSESRCISMERDHSYFWTAKICDERLPFICEVKIGN